MPVKSETAAHSSTEVKPVLMKAPAQKPKAESQVIKASPKMKAELKKEPVPHAKESVPAKKTIT